MTQQDQNYALARTQEFTAALQGSYKSISSVLPEGTDPARFARMAINACHRNPELLNCDKGTFIMAVINCAESGLEPSLGQAALVPYKGKVQFQPMYQGLVDLAYRSGEVQQIRDAVVREGDIFEYELGLEPKLRHIPSGQPNKGATHFYCVVNMRQGPPLFHVMTEAECLSYKDRSPAAHSKYSPWQTDPEKMCLKTVIKQTLRLVPKSYTLRKVITLDDQAEAGKNQTPTAAEIDMSAIGADNLAETGDGAPQSGTEKPPAPPKISPARRKLLDEALSFGLDDLPPDITNKGIKDAIDAELARRDKVEADAQAAAEEAGTALPKDNLFTK